MKPHEDVVVMDVGVGAEEEGMAVDVAEEEVETRGTHALMRGSSSALMEVDWRCTHPTRSMMINGRRYHRK